MKTKSQVKVHVSKKESTVSNQQGMINYLSKFSPRLSELAQPTRELSKDKVPFNWGPEHQHTFTQMKKEISSVPVLAYYNPEKQITLQTDASVKGLGACLLQDDRQVYFASKALTDAQKSYVEMELESLAVAWAMEKIHHFYIPETTWSHIVKGFDSSNSKITADTNQNICLPIDSKIYVWYY